MLLLLLLLHMPLLLLLLISLFTLLPRSGSPSMQVC
jgi:hypothetical protein